MGGGAVGGKMRVNKTRKSIIKIEKNRKSFNKK
jgi:hypothetical protein